MANNIRLRNNLIEKESHSMISPIEPKRNLIKSGHLQSSSTSGLDVPPQSP